MRDPAFPFVAVRSGHVLGGGADWLPGAISEQIAALKH